MRKTKQPLGIPDCVESPQNVVDTCKTKRDAVAAPMPNHHPQSPCWYQRYVLPVHHRIALTASVLNMRRASPLSFGGFSSLAPCPTTPLSKTLHASTQA